MKVQGFTAIASSSRLSRTRAAWWALGVLGSAACAQSANSVEDPDLGGTGGTSASAGSGGSAAGAAGTFTAFPGGGGATASSGGSGAASGSAGTANAGAGGECAAAGGTCEDQCPDDPDKTEPGSCGCGVADVDCQGLKDALVHRYSFDGTGTTISDLVGDAHGTVIDAMVSGNGLLTLGAGGYGELPPGIVSTLTDASFEAWVNWTASDGAMWQRIFDFGVSDAGQGMQGTGESYLFLAVDTFRFCYRQSGETPEVFVDAAQDFPSPATAHVVAVFDDAGDEMRLYLNGAAQGAVAVAGSLSAITDANNWLGRSQYAPDPAFGGSIREFRIYDVALSQAQIELSHALGEDPDFLK